MMKIVTTLYWHVLTRTCWSILKLDNEKQGI